MIFAHIPKADVDPILGLVRAFDEDPRKNKINLGVGVYKTADLHSYLLTSVKKAQEKLCKEVKPKEYLPIEGDLGYVKALRDLIFSADNAMYFDRCCGAQAIGGTGAIRVLADFLYQWGYQHVLISDPTWPNHNQVFEKCGYQISLYPYCNIQTMSLNFKGMCEALHTAPEKSVVLLQASCHNPTGLDLSHAQWQVIAEIMHRREHIAFFDVAYQGFGEGLEEDVYALRLFLQQELPFVAAYSCSKNFGLYGERVGALFVVAESAEYVPAIESQIKRCIRSNYSNPPTTGSQLVKCILNTPELAQEWRKEVDMMRSRIQQMRLALVEHLSAENTGKNFNFMHQQKGMFSFCGLNKEQVESLRAQYGIYMPKNGRINVAGLTTSNLPIVSQAIRTVVTAR